MTSAVATMLALACLASELYVVGGPAGPSLDDVKKAQCPDQDKPHKCVGANGSCYGFKEYCNDIAGTVESCFPLGTDEQEWCRSGKAPIHPQCKYACMDQFGQNTSGIPPLATQEPPADSKECKCPLHSCRNSTATQEPPADSKECKCPSHSSSNGTGNTEYSHGLIIHIYLAPILTALLASIVPIVVKTLILLKKRHQKDRITNAQIGEEIRTTQDIIGPHIDADQVSVQAGGHLPREHEIRQGRRVQVTHRRPNDEAAQPLILGNTIVAIHEDEAGVTEETPSSNNDGDVSLEEDTRL